MRRRRRRREEGGGGRREGRVGRGGRRRREEEEQGLIFIQLLLKLVHFPLCSRSLDLGKLQIQDQVSVMGRSRRVEGGGGRRWKKRG